MADDGLNGATDGAEDQRDDESAGAPLDGVRVLDLSGPIGAYCTRLLADLGADVVIVEPPDGDPLRRAAPFAGDDPSRSLVFAYYHASKRSVVVDADETRVYDELGAGADVVVVSPSRRAPVPGWDPDAATVAWAPNAVVCAITPFGLTGPIADWDATPMVSFAMGGNMIRVGAPEGPPVTLPGRQIWDEAGAHAAVAILAALEVVGTVGPQSIDLSVHEIATGRDFSIEEYDVRGMSTHGRSVGIGYPPTGTYECADGPFSLACHQVQHWDAFLEMLEHPAELADPVLVDPLVRRERHEHLGEVVRALVKGRCRSDLVERGQAARLPCAVINRPTEFVVDDQLEHRGSIAACPTPWGEASMPVAGSGFRSAPSLVGPRTSAPSEPGASEVSWEPRTPVAVRGDLQRRPLSGVRVLSFGAFVAGNTTAAILGQLGADVVKIEPRSRAEVLRSPAYAFGPVVTEPSGVTNTVMYASLARSAREVSIDVARPEGADLFRKVVRVAEVVIENFGSGVIDAWGLDFDRLRAENPRVVLTSLSGYGRTGPRSSYLAYASNIANFTGQSYSWNFAHGTQSDYLTAVHAALGTIAALRRVRATGEAVRIDAAQIEAMAATMPEAVLEALGNDRDLVPPGNEVAGSLLSGVFRCTGHDAWIAVDVHQLDSWGRLCDLLDLPVHASSIREAAELRPALEAALHGWAAGETAHTAARALQGAGVAAGAVQSMEDVWRDPQLWARDVPVALPQVDLGAYHYAESPYRLSRTPGRVGRVAGRLGEDTSAVLESWLGLRDDEVTQLLESGAAFQG